MRYNKHWKPAEEVALRKGWRKEPEARQKLASQMGRTLGALWSRASLLGLNCQPAPWVPRERKVLLAHFGKGEKSASDIAAMLPGRSRSAVLGEAHRLREATGYPPRMKPPTRGDWAGVQISYRTPSLPRLRCLEDTHAQ